MKATSKNNSEILNRWAIRKALNAGEKVYGIDVRLYEFRGDDSEYVGSVDGYPEYFTDKAAYEQALAYARTMSLREGEEIAIEYGSVNVDWAGFLAGECFDDVAEYDDEWREYEYSEIEDAIIVEWSWQKHVGYCQKLISVAPAWRMGIKTSKDLITGNEERTFLSNYSVLLTDEDVKNYCHEMKYDKAIAEKVAEALNASCYKWEWYAKYTADDVKEFDIDFID